MAVKEVKYRVKYMESERGWGQKYFHRDFDTREAAQAAIDASNEENEAEYDELGRVPDYYCQADDRIVIVEA